MGLKLFYRTYCKEEVKIQSYIYIERERTVVIKTCAGMYLNLGYLYKPESPNISVSYMYQSNWKYIYYFILDGFAFDINQIKITAR